MLHFQMFLWHFSRHGEMVEAANAPSMYFGSYVDTFKARFSLENLWASDVLVTVSYIRVNYLRGINIGVFLFFLNETAGERVLFRRIHEQHVEKFLSYITRLERISL